MADYKFAQSDMEVPADAVMDGPVEDAAPADEVPAREDVPVDSGGDAPVQADDVPQDEPAVDAAPDVQSDPEPVRRMEPDGVGDALALEVKQQEAFAKIVVGREHGLVSDESMSKLYRNKSVGEKFDAYVTELNEAKQTDYKSATPRQKQLCGQYSRARKDKIPPKKPPHKPVKLAEQAKSVNKKRKHRERENVADLSPKEAHESMYGGLREDSMGSGMQQDPYADMYAHMMREMTARAMGQYAAQGPAYAQPGSTVYPAYAPPPYGPPIRPVPQAQPRSVTLEDYMQPSVGAAVPQADYTVGPAVPERVAASMRGLRDAMGKSLGGSAYAVMSRERSEDSTPVRSDILNRDGDSRTELRREVRDLQDRMRQQDLNRAMDEPNPPGVPERVAASMRSLRDTVDKSRGRSAYMGMNRESPEDSTPVRGDILNHGGDSRAELRQEVRDLQDRMRQQDLNRAMERPNRRVPDFSEDFNKHEPEQAGRDEDVVASVLREMDAVEDDMRERGLLADSSRTDEAHSQVEEACKSAKRRVSLQNGDISPTDEFDREFLSDSRESQDSSLDNDYAMIIVGRERGLISDEQLRQIDKDTQGGVSAFADRAYDAAKAYNTPGEMSDDQDRTLGLLQAYRRGTADLPSTGAEFDSVGFGDAMKALRAESPDPTDELDEGVLNSRVLSSSKSMGSFSPEDRAVDQAAYAGYKAIRIHDGQKTEELSEELSFEQDKVKDRAFASILAIREKGHVGPEFMAVVDDRTDGGLTKFANRVYDRMAENDGKAPKIMERAREGVADTPAKHVDDAEAARGVGRGFADSVRYLNSRDVAQEGGYGRKMQEFDSNIMSGQSSKPGLLDRIKERAMQAKQVPEAQSELAEQQPAASAEDKKEGGYVPPWLKERMERPQADVKRYEIRDDDFLPIDPPAGADAGQADKDGPSGLKDKAMSREEAEHLLGGREVPDRLAQIDSDSVEPRQPEAGRGRSVGDRLESACAEAGAGPDVEPAYGV